MPSFFTVLLCNLLFGILSAELAYELTVCAIFQNDAKWLPEWIEFHEKQGVEHFYLYNNCSNDDYKNILKPYVDRGLVELTDWMLPSNNVAEFNLVQCSAYEHCLKRIANEANWCAVIDTDEFLFSANGRPLTETLKEYEKYSGVLVNWICYGTSGVDQIPAHQKMTETLLLRAPIDCTNNYFVKSIVKPRDISGCDCPHYCRYKTGKRSVTENKTFTSGVMRSKTVSVKKLRINHYWSRDLDFFYNVKIARWIKWGIPYSQSIEKEAQMNAEYDDIILSIPH
jgi:hypothetical protein